MIFQQSLFISEAPKGMVVRIWSIEFQLKSDILLYRKRISEVKVFPSKKYPNGSKRIGEMILSDCQFHKNK